MKKRPRIGRAPASRFTAEQQFRHHLSMVSDEKIEEVIARLQRTVDSMPPGRASIPYLRHIALAQEEQRRRTAFDAQVKPENSAAVPRGTSHPDEAKP